MVYFGELGRNFESLFAYFESIGMRCPPGMNPADFVLDVCYLTVSSFCVYPCDMRIFSLMYTYARAALCVGIRMYVWLSLITDI